MAADAHASELERCPASGDSDWETNFEYDSDSEGGWEDGEWF